MKRAAASGSWTWPAIVAAVAALVGIPIAVIVTRVGADPDGVFAHLSRTVLPGYVRNTLLLAAGVALTTLLIGVGTAWLVTMCRFPGVRWFRWALLLPLAIPAYLSAYALTDLLQFAGPVQGFLRETFDWSRDDYWFPPIRSLGGAIAILSLALYPYVYLAARAAFLEQSVCVLEVSRLLGLGPWRSFRRVALPLARPSLIAGVSLVLMETVAEFGAVDYCAVDTFATGIYRTWRAYGLTPAAQLATILLGVVVLLLLLEGAARRSARYHATTSRHRELPSWRLTRGRGLLAFLGCCLPILFGFLLPAGLFVKMSLERGDARLGSFLTLSGNTVLLATVASLIATGLALLVAYGRRLQPSRFVRGAARIAGVGYAVPGGVIAIGILISVGALDRGLQATLGSWLAGPTGPIVGGTILALILGYQTRFLAVSLNFVGAGLTRVRPSLDDAARMLGATQARVLGRLHVPLLKGSLLAAALLVFVDVAKELPATLILRPFNFDTLAVRVYHLASDERLTEASTGALAIILIGLVPVLLLSRLMQRARPGSTTEKASTS